MRGSRPVLREAGGAIPPAYSPSGAGGTISTDAVAKAAPDGFTLLFVSTSLTTNAATGKKLPYNPIKDLQPIGEVAAAPLMIVVSQRPQGEDAGRAAAFAIRPLACRARSHDQDRSW